MWTELMRQPAPTLDNPQRVSDHKWPEGTIPLLSIICATYNHEKFVEQCVEGFLMQETSFPVEIIIHDDASTDGTADIIRDYAAKHPGLFRLILQTENQMQVGKNCFPELSNVARGDYIALCEGDDYWIDRRKLQLQVDLLTRHDGCNVCFHPVFWLDEKSGVRRVTAYGAPGIKWQYDLSELLVHSNFIPTCSAMLKNASVRKLPQWFSECLIGDLPLHMISIMRSRGGYALMYPAVMGVYRRHSGGIHGGSSKVANSKRLLRTYHAIGRDPHIGNLAAYAKSIDVRRKELLDAIIQDTRWPGTLRASWHAFEDSPSTTRLKFAFSAMRTQLSIAFKQKVKFYLRPVKRQLKKTLPLTIQNAAKAALRMSSTASSLTRPLDLHEILQAEMQAKRTIAAATLIDGVRERALRFVNIQRFSDDLYAYRYSPNGWPSLYGSVYAVMAKSLGGELEGMSPAEHERWARHINGYQCLDGLYRDSLLENDIAETEDWWGWRHLSAHVVSALAFLNARTETPFHFLESLYPADKCAAWIRSLPWAEKADFVSNTVMNYGVLLQYNRDVWKHDGAAQALQAIYEYLDMTQDADSGLWGYDRSTGAVGLSRAVQTSYDLWNLYFYDRRPIRYMERAIDNLLATQNLLGGFGVASNSNACEDIHSIDPLCRFYFVTDHRRADIRGALEKALRWVAVNQMDDGGFVFRRFEAWEYGHRLMASKAEESNLFATWFRLLSVAYMTEVLAPHLQQLWSWHQIMGYQFRLFDKSTEEDASKRRSARPIINEPRVH